MSEDEMVVAIVFGSITAIVVISLLYSLLRTWIKSCTHAYDEEKFDRLAKAFIQHKKDVDLRLQKLEGNSDRDKSESAQTANKLRNNKRSHTSIEIKGQDEANQSQKKSDSGRLRNMLDN